MIFFGHIKRDWKILLFLFAFHSPLREITQTIKKNVTLVVKDNYCRRLL